MPSIEVIKAAAAPNVPKKQSAYATELLNAVGALKKDEVLKIAPDEGKSLRGLKTGIGRVTKSAGVKVTVWDDGEVAYVAKA